MNSRNRGFTDITAKVDALASAGATLNGIANLFTAPTSCLLSISENADPAARCDLERQFARAVPDGDAPFEHDDDALTICRPTCSPRPPA